MENVEFPFWPSAIGGILAFIYSIYFLYTFNDAIRNIVSKYTDDKVIKMPLIVYKIFVVEQIVYIWVAPNVDAVKQFIERHCDHIFLSELYDLAVNNPFIFTGFKTWFCRSNEISDDIIGNMSFVDSFIAVFLMYFFIFAIYPLVAGLLCNWTVAVLLSLLEVAYYAIVYGPAKRAQLEEANRVAQAQSNWKKNNKKEGSFIEKQLAVSNESVNSNDKDTAQKSGVLSSAIEERRNQVKAQLDKKTNKSVNTREDKEIYNTPQGVNPEQNKKIKTNTTSAVNKETNVPDFDRMSLQEKIEYVKNHKN